MTSGEREWQGGEARNGRADLTDTSEYVGSEFSKTWYTGIYSTQCMRSHEDQKDKDWEKV